MKSTDTSGELKVADTYDLDRLEELRDRHRVTLADYRRASGAAQEAVKALAHLRAAAAATAIHPAAAAAAAAAAALGTSPWPLPVMRERERRVVEATEATEATEAPPPSRLEQQISAAENRLARLTVERDKLTGRVRQSTAFASRLELFAKMKNL